MIPFDSVNLVSVLIATVAAMALGMFWYSPKGLFGKQWMELTGVKDPNPEEAKSAMFKGFITTFVSAYSVGLLLEMLNPSSLKEGLSFAIVAWVGIVVLIQAGYVIWEQRPAKLMKINALYYLAYLLVTVVILMQW